MNEESTLDEMLLVEMSRRNTDLIADLVFQNPVLFEDLFRIYLRNEEPVSRRAVWVIDTVAEKHPELLSGHLDEIVEMLPALGHDGLRRHSLRMLSRSPLPSGDHMGILLGTCFDWLLSPTEAVAAKVYCMDLLYRISEIEPDVKKELADTIEWRMHEETPGFKNHGAKLLKKLYREMAK